MPASRECSYALVGFDNCRRSQEVISANTVKMRVIKQLERHVAMKISRADTPVRRVDSVTEIVPLFDGTDAAFDVAIGVIDGDHGKRVNRMSDRVYFVLSGTFDVQVGEQKYEARTHDTFIIPAGTKHGISGTGEVLIITAPPFVPENESDA
jgi:mannose-6-phosphate isomerase-like protein (cupin superfamily)